MRDDLRFLQVWNSLRAFVSRKNKPFLWSRQLFSSERKRVRMIHLLLGTQKTRMFLLWNLRLHGFDRRGASLGDLPASRTLRQRRKDDWRNEFRWKILPWFIAVPFIPSSNPAPSRRIRSLPTLLKRRKNEKDRDGKSFSKSGGGVF